MTKETKKPANKMRMNKSQIKEALDQLPIDRLISGISKESKLTAKQKGFAKDVALGKTKAQAYRDNYNTKANPKVVGNAGYNLASTDVISMEIVRQKMENEVKHIIKGDRLRDLVLHELTLHAMDKDNPPSSRIRSLELLGKASNLFVEQKITQVHHSSDSSRLKLIEQIKQAMERNAITIDADDGDSLLAELQTPIVDSDSDATHYPHTPLIEHGHHDESMHSIPHKQSSPNENNSQTTIAEDVDFKEEKK